MKLSKKAQAKAQFLKAGFTWLPPKLAKVAMKRHSKKTAYGPYWTHQRIDNGIKNGKRRFSYTWYTPFGFNWEKEM